MSTLPQAATSVKPQEVYCKECDLDHAPNLPACSTCGIHTLPENIALCWRRDWAGWGVIRQFRLFCSLECTGEYNRPHYDEEGWHSVPLRGSRHELGFLESPLNLIHDLRDSTLTLSGHALQQLVDLAQPDEAKRGDLWCEWWDTLLEGKADARPHR